MRRHSSDGIRSRPSHPAGHWAAGLTAAGCRALLAILFAPILTSSCAILSPPPPRSGGSTISAAAEEAKKSEPEKRKDGEEPKQKQNKKDEEKHKRLEAGEKVEPPPTVEVEVERFDDPVSDFESMPPPPGYAPRTGPRWRVGFIGGGGSVGGHMFDGFGLAGLVAATTPTPRTRVDLVLLALPTRFSIESGLGGALVNPIDLAADLSARYQLTPDYAALGVYPIVGMRFGTLFWDYRNPILLDEDGTTRRVSDDWINYYAPYAGIGVGIVRTRRVELGVNLTGGVRFYDGHTQEGLRNDRFETAGFGQLSVEGTLRF